jgi:conjugal transfer pilin signal peptidase TrbI
MHASILTKPGLDLHVQHTTHSAGGRRRGVAQRLSLVRQFLQVSWQAWRRHAWWLLLPVVAIEGFAIHYKLAINVTESLPYRVAIIEKGNMNVQAGDLVAFRWTQGPHIPVGLELLKRVEGVMNDQVQQVPCPPRVQPSTGLLTAVQSCLQVQRHDGSRSPVAHVKALSRSFEPMTQGPVGTVPEQRYVVMGDHPDSLDSRYQFPGWIRADQLVGKAVWVW